MKHLLHGFSIVLLIATAFLFMPTQTVQGQDTNCDIVAQNDTIYTGYSYYISPFADGWTFLPNEILGNDFANCDGELTITGFSNVQNTSGISFHNANSDFFPYFENDFYYYTPTDLLEPVLFDYEVCNEQGNCSTATVYAYVASAIVAVDDYASTPMNTPVTINATENDIVTGAENLEWMFGFPPTNEQLFCYISTSDAENGTISYLNGDNYACTFTYTPNIGFVGTEIISYATLFEFDSQESYGTVYITVGNEQQPQNTQIIFPPFPDCAEEIDCESVPTININATPFCDVEFGGYLIEVTVTGGAPEANGFGAYSLNYPILSGSLTGTPPLTAVIEAGNGTAFQPNDSIIINGHGGESSNPLCNTSTLVVIPSETCESCCPIAVDDEVTIPMNSSITIEILENDISPCGFPIFPSGFSISGSIFLYAPPIDFVGTETFTYLACNLTGPSCCDTATITIHVVDEPENQNRTSNLSILNEENSSLDDCIVTAQDDVFYTEYVVLFDWESSDGWIASFGTNLSNDFSSCDDDSLTFTLLEETIQNGNITNSSSYDLLYEYDNLLEPFTFDYTVCNDENICDTATVQIFPNEIIIAEDDYVSTTQNTSININVGQNDIAYQLDFNIFDEYEYYSANENLDYWVTGGNQPANGTLTPSVNNGSYIYTPNPDFVGTDSFVYIARFGFDAFADNATVYITVGSEQQTSPCQPACSNTTAEYSVNPTAGSTYEWEIGGANNFISNNNEVQIDWAETGDGYIQMIETLANGTTNSTTVCIDIVATPNAQINSIPAATNDTISVCSGQNIQFSATNATDANEFLWIFGNGATATSQNTTFSYTASGIYEAQLIANSDCMCSDTTSIFVNVDAAITPQIDCTGTVCRGDIMTYETSAVCGSYFWDISEEGTVIDGGTASDNFVTIHWLGNDNIGVIELTVSSCTEAYCEIPARYEIPIVGNENLNISGIDVVCSGDIAVYSVPNMSGVSYNWNNVNGGEFLSGTTSNEVTVQWTNPPFEEGQVDGPWGTPFVSLEIENCFLGCSAQQFFYVDIRDVLDIFVPEQTACENEPITMYSTILGEGSAHPFCDWTITTPTQETIFIENEDVLADYQWQNGAGTYHIEIVPTNPNAFCNEKTSTTIDVVSPPTAPTAISGETTICPAQIYNYSVPNNEDYTFVWNVYQGNETTETEGNAINVNFNIASVHSVSVAHQSKEFPFCQSEFTTLDIVNLDNELELTGDASICIYETATYTVEFSGVQEGVVWNVEPASAAIVIDQNDTQLLVQWQNSGTVVATYCGATDSINVTVNALPEPEIVAPDGICFESSTNISTATTYSNYTWYKDSVFYSSSPTPSLDEGGFYQVEVIDENGCFGSASKSIATYPLPEAFVSSPNFLDVCDDIFEINLYTPVSDAEPYHYQWYQNGLEVGTDTSHYLTPEAGNYHVVVTNIYGCSVVSNTKIINAAACPTGDGPTCTIPSFPTFTATVSEFCDSILFENTASGFIPNTTNWNFDYPFGSTSTLETPSFLYDKVGYYTVVMRVTYENSTPPPASCQVGVAQDITISIKADFEANPVCLGDTTTFSDLSTYLDGYNIASWTWTSSDGAVSTAQNPQLVYETAGEHSVTLEIMSDEGCIDRMTKMVTVLPPPTAEINFVSEGCQNVAISFSGQSNDNITKWEWNFGDENSSELNSNIAISQNATHIFGEAGIYEVSLIATNNIGCTVTATQNIEIVENELFGEILLSNPSPMCIGDSTILSFSEHNENLNYQWSNGSTSESITVFASNVYDLTVTDEIGCSFRTQQAVIDIIALPNNYLYAEITQNSDDFSIAGNEVDVCFGSIVTIFAEENEEYTYLWSNNKTTSSIDIETEDLDTNENMYSVTITNEIGCESFADFTINLRDAPAEFGIISLSENNCLAAGENIILEIINPQENLTYFWNNGTYGTSTIVAEGGTYFATAVNETGCETTSNGISVYDVPNVYMLQTGCFTECSPKEICLATSNVELSNYQWLLDGTPISNANDDSFMATESGIYQVEITSENGCTSLTDGLNLTLEDCSVCDLTAEVYEDCNETTETYQLYFEVNGGQAPYTITGSYDAAFADVSPSVQQSPTFGFNTPYNITITDALGCAFSFANEEICTSLPVELISFSGRMTENANLLEWKTASEINNDFFTLSRKAVGENTFSAIAKIEAAGNSSISQKYNYTDAFTESGLVQYQLSQTDFDGTTKKVGTISLVRETAGLQILEVSPVPTHDFVVIKYILPESRSESRLSLFDMHGRKVYEKTLANEENQQQEVISLSQLSSGVYTLSLENGNERVIEKVVKY